MKIRFMGKYNNDPSSLPKGEMVEGSNRIKKIDNLAVLTIVMTVLSCVFLYVLGMLLIDIFGKELLSKAGVFAVFMSFFNKNEIFIEFSLSLKMYTVCCSIVLLNSS